MEACPNGSNGSTKMTQLEKEIQADIVKLLNTVGAAVYKIGTTRKKGDHQGTMQTPGIPDLVAFVPTSKKWPDGLQQFSSIEVQRPGVSHELVANGVPQTLSEVCLRTRDRRRRRGLGLAEGARGGEVRTCLECGILAVGGLTLSCVAMPCANRRMRKSPTQSS